MASEVLIEGLGASGDGVGRLPDGRVVFVEGGLPGDRVRVQLGEQRKRVQYAQLVEILQPSAERVLSRCRIDRCGGCALKTYSNAGQGEAKRARVVETLRRLGGIDLETLLGPLRQFGDGWTYRHRVRLHARWTGDRYEIGYHARRSRHVLAFRTCPVLATPLEQVAARVSDGLATLPKHAQLSEVEIAYSARDTRAVLHLTGLGPVTPYRRLAGSLGALGVSGLAVHTPHGRFRYGNIELRYDHARGDDFDLRFEAGVFTQAYPLANDRLVDAVLTAARPQQSPRVLELHAGIGNFSLPLARGGARVTAVERDRRTAILCRRNAQRAGLPLQVLDQSDDEALALLSAARLAPSDTSPRTTGEFDVVLLDPPRTGAHEVAKALAESGPPRVIYVSCDPATLARDAGLLVRAGYTPVRAEAFDLFPQTPHVEVLLVLDRPP